MLELRNITKNYKAGTNEVLALRGIDVKFRESEFVSILGPSGCGKTTLLNIIGGLDRFSSGDLIINGLSTTKFHDRDWDAYRNNSVGFVFQTYNLISHQSVISNVEMSLTLSGISKSERRLRAKDVLERVGLGDQLNKKPNQLSGGQMQRVAIARALINEPDILLADEPTGALDSETSGEIMELLCEISKGKLVIMVTHNPDIAEKYSTRIIRLLDGRITSDSDPVVDGTDETNEFKFKRTSMSYVTALALSVSNLMTKKARTILTAFAGSIGIIGIALILSLSNGLQTYIDDVERDTLSAYPITIEKETMDISGMLSTMQDNRRPDDADGREEGRIYVNNLMIRLINLMSTQMKSNDLKSFMAYIESHKDELSEYTTAVQYSYSIDRNLYHLTDDGWFQVNPSTMFYDMYGIDRETSQSGTMMNMSMFSNADMWHQLTPNQEFLESQYEVVAGKMPEGPFEAMLVVSENDTIPDLLVYSLGLKGQKELDELVSFVLQQDSSVSQLNEERLSYLYNQIIGLEYALLAKTDFYEKLPDGTWTDRSEDPAFLASKCAAADKVKIVGIVRPSEEAAAVSDNTYIGVNHDLDEYLIDRIASSEIIRDQLANPDIDILTGMPFQTAGTPMFNTIEEFMAFTAMLPEDRQTEINTYIELMRQTGMTDDQIVNTMKNRMVSSESTIESNLETLQYTTIDNPSTINIYASSFENKDLVADFISGYNAIQSDGGEITYTDYIGLLLSSVTTVINAISYILIAFVSISLIVSSIMIGIITYISVLERTREIGVLRALGASKRDISRVFNSETVFIGFVAGALGIIVTVLLCIPANIIIKYLTDVGNLARLPIVGGVALILISMFLTFIAGLIPSRVAAKKDPVVALRTE